MIEVADTSLEKDRSKISIYREAGVHEYWIVNVNEELIESFDFSQNAPNGPTTKDDAIKVMIGDIEIELRLSELF